MAMISITAYAAEGDITITIDKASGSTSRTLWTSTANPGVILSMDGGSIVTDRNDDGGNLVLSTDGATRTVTLTSTDPDYFVSAYTIDAVGVEGDNVTFNAGSTTITTNRTSQTFAVSGIQADGTASFTITPNVAEAKKAICGNFKVTISPKDATPSLPIYTEGSIDFPGAVDGELRSLSSFLIKLPENAKPTGAEKIMILNEQLNNTVWQIEASELAYDATQGAFTATITPAIDIDGTYTVIVPKGTFNIVSTEDGTTPEQIVDNMSASVNVVFSADPVALQITPAEGKLTEITSITISYTDDNGTAYSLVPVITDSEAVPTVTLAKGTETVLSLDADKIYDYEVIENEKSSFNITGEGIDFKAAGTYTLTIPAGFFDIDGLKTTNLETTAVWTIDENVGISEITITNGSQTTVYDLQGRRADSSARGILIVNGVKTLVK